MSAPQSRHARARNRGPLAFTAKAQSRSISQRSTSAVATQLIKTSGRKTSTALLTSPSLVMSNSVLGKAMTLHPPRARCAFIDRPSNPPAPVIITVEGSDNINSPSACGIRLGSMGGSATVSAERSAPGNALLELTSPLILESKLRILRCSSSAVHSLVVLEVFARPRASNPFSVVAVPAHGLLDAALESLTWIPAEFGFYPGRIGGVAAIVTKTVGHELDQ